MKSKVIYSNTKNINEFRIEIDANYRKEIRILIFYISITFTDFKLKCDYIMPEVPTFTHQMNELQAARLAAKTYQDFLKSFEIANNIKALF